MSANPEMRKKEKQSGSYFRHEGGNDIRGSLIKVTKGVILPLIQGRALTAIEHASKTKPKGANKNE